MLNFSIHDNRVWMRNYQIILEGENKVKEDKFKPEVVEIGPRIVLNLQRIQEGPFSGQAILVVFGGTLPTSAREKKEDKKQKHFLIV